MQIKSIMTVAGAVACIFLEWPAIAAGAPNPPGIAVNHDDQIATASKYFISQAAAEDDVVETIEIDAGAIAKDEANTQTGETPETSIEQPQMATPKPAVALPDRSTRPRVNHKKDARVCLGAGDNLAIIKCAEPYR